eukprot:CAMPEP_0116011250 /NCGR_PEP_ID=MMETSP0321-20121206/4462_1 /TAXON_ID=163516 /ORGANISM="Leptocylindrus danicus var. danicus, Strain B650" /LENGTH=500 /DNA_ID=CAMNT_0003480459 /DNA_START=47 /DNA_END=1546 /DNA_ORIENTATION=+
MPSTASTGKPAPWFLDDHEEYANKNGDDNTLASFRWSANCSEDAKHSDYTIEVTTTCTSTASTTASSSNNKDDNKQEKRTTNRITTTYYVHKSVLIFAGDRKSEYFERMFDTTLSVKENTESVSKIELAHAVAVAFPIMLDFIYFPFDMNPEKKDIEVSTSNAVPLRVLSNYFGIRGLHQLVNTFINLDLSVNTCIEYMVNAEACSDVKLISAATEACAEFFDDIESNALLSLSPERIQQVVSVASFNSMNGERFSVKIMDYMKAYPELLSKHPDAFQSILCCEKMPSIDISACVFFLLLDVDDKVYKCTSKKSRCLYDRCIASYGDKWSVHSSVEDQLKTLPIEVQNDLLCAALSSARVMTKQIVPRGSQVLMRQKTLKTCEGIRFNDAAKREISVSGAGFRAANGIYVLSGLYNEHPSYEKGAVIDGIECVISIVNLDGCWWISRLYANEQDGDDIDYYRFVVDDEVNEDIYPDLDNIVAVVVRDEYLPRPTMTYINW